MPPGNIGQTLTRCRAGVAESGRARMAELGYVNIFAQDVVKLAGFYADVFGFEEISPAARRYSEASNQQSQYRIDASTPTSCLICRNRRTAAGSKAFTTFDVDSAGEVDRLTPIAVAKGATLRKAPFTTYYGWYQSVLLYRKATRSGSILSPHSTRRSGVATSVKFNAKPEIDLKRALLDLGAAHDAR